MNVAMTHLWSLLHVDHVVGFGVFVVFQVSSLDYDLVDLLRARLFRGYLSAHRVRCCDFL